MKPTLSSGGFSVLDEAFFRIVRIIIKIILSIQNYFWNMCPTTV